MFKVCWIYNSSRNKRVVTLKNNDKRWKNFKTARQLFDESGIILESTMDDDAPHSIEVIRGLVESAMVSNNMEYLVHIIHKGLQEYVEVSM